MSAAKRILFWHGYLLSGSGSNLLTANLVRVWRTGGHDVLLLCQDRAAAAQPFVDAAGDFSADNSRFDLTATRNPTASGSLALARPDIAGLLPVYVYDSYVGFRVKTFLDLTDAELGSYVSANVAALVTAIGEHRPDAILVGHEVMGPYIARLVSEQTGYGYTALIHGSATLFVVSKQQRYVPYARDGLAGATAVIGGTSAVVAKTEQAIGSPIASVHVINPGCDTELFQPAQRASDAPPTVGYVGKFIASKGVQNLLTSLGMTATPGLQCRIVGFGSLEPTLHQLASALRDDDRSRVRGVVDAAPEPLTDVAALLDSGTDDAAFAARARDVSVTWLGRLEHDALSEVLPCFDVLVVPSVAPEAFGMVAAGAAAAGVLRCGEPHRAGRSGCGDRVRAFHAGAGHVRSDRPDSGDRPVLGCLLRSESRGACGNLGAAGRTRSSAVVLGSGGGAVTRRCCRFCEAVPQLDVRLRALRIKRHELQRRSSDAANSLVPATNDPLPCRRTRQNCSFGVLKPRFCRVRRQGC